MIPLRNRGEAEILYPDDLGIQMEKGYNMISLKFPQPNMGVIIKVVKK
jgi:alpha-galactosidase